MLRVVTTEWLIPSQTPGVSYGELCALSPFGYASGKRSTARFAVRRPPRFNLVAVSLPPQQHHTFPPSTLSQLPTRTNHTLPHHQQPRTLETNQMEGFSQKRYALAAAGWWRVSQDREITQQHPCAASSIHPERCCASSRSLFGR